ARLKGCATDDASLGVDHLQRALAFFERPGLVRRVEVLAGQAGHLILLSDRDKRAYTRLELVTIMRCGCRSLPLWWGPNTRRQALPSMKSSRRAERRPGSQLPDRSKRRTSNGVARASCFCTNPNGAGARWVATPTGTEWRVY